MKEMDSLTAVQNRDVTVHRILALGGSQADCIIALANEKEKLHERIMELDGICPKRIRLPNGSIATYHCPEHLIPVIES